MFLFETSGLCSFFQYNSFGKGLLDDHYECFIVMVVRAREY